MIRTFISRWKNEQKEREQKELELKVYELRHWITKAFEEQQITEGGVYVPAWMECKTVMLKLGITIENKDIVNFYYKKLQYHKATAA